MIVTYLGQIVKNDQREGSGTHNPVNYYLIDFGETDIEMTDIKVVEILEAVIKKYSMSIPQMHIVTKLSDFYYERTFNYFRN